MGYRLTIKCKDAGELCVGKFYGYVDGKNLKSMDYLCKKYGDLEPGWFNCGIIRISLTAEEFREFIDLYQKDIEHHNFEGSWIKGWEELKPIEFSRIYSRDGIFDKIYNSDQDKLLAWD